MERQVFAVDVERTSLVLWWQVMMSPLSRSNPCFVGTDFAEKFDERRFGFAGDWLGAVRGWGHACAGASGQRNISCVAMERAGAACLRGHPRPVAYLLYFRGDAGGI